MTEKQIAIGAGHLQYTEKQGNIVITAWHGVDSEVSLPSTIDGMPVTTIGKKAFLSQKGIKRITLPETVAQIEDWAFAYCDSLEDILLESKSIRFGRAVFLDCKSLKQVAMSGKEMAIGCLLATAVIGLDAPYLCDVEQAGTQEWLDKFDARLLMVLHAPDAEGYSKQVLCGEEDYGSTDMEAFLSEKRKKKVDLALTRLLYDRGILKELADELKEYLLAHTKGCKSEETWKVILVNYGEKRAFYELFAEIGCINDQNIDGLMQDIGEDYPEMKAYFLSFHQTKRGGHDFFEDLEL